LAAVAPAGGLGNREGARMANQRLFIVQRSTEVGAARSRDNFDRTANRTPFARSGARPQQPSICSRSNLCKSANKTISMRIHIYHISIFEVTVINYRILWYFDPTYFLLSQVSSRGRYCNRLFLNSYYYDLRFLRNLSHQQLIWHKTIK